jgi:hypothetical protein
MLGSTPYAGILQFYVVLFAAMPLLVWITRRVPIGACLIAAVAVHLAFPLLKMVPAPPTIGGQPMLQRLIDLTVGAGTGAQIAGPSLLHSMVLVVSGFQLGRWLRAAPDERPALWPIFAVFLLMGLWSLSISGYGDVSLAGLAGMRLRNLNHPAYIFLIGGIALMLTAGLAVAMRGRRVPDVLLVLGRRSLFGFGFGNMVITFWPHGLTQAWGPGASVTILLGAVVALIFAYDLALRGAGHRHSPSALVRAMARGSDRLTEGIANMALGRRRRHRSRLRRSSIAEEAPQALPL